MGRETVFEDLDGMPDGASAVVDDKDIAKDEYGEQEITFDSGDDLGVTVVDEEIDLEPISDEPDKSKVTLDFDPDAIDGSVSSAVLALKKENIELKRGSAEAALKRHQDGYEAAKKELHEAIEAGDTEKQVDINDRMIDLKAQMVTSQIEVESLADPVDEVNPALQAWIDKNAWYQDSVNEKHQDAVHRIDKKLVSEGKDPRNPAYFVELNRRLSEEEPDLFIGGAAKQEVRETSKPRQTGPGPAPQRTAASNSRKGSNKVVLTRQDLATMEEFGLDPNNREHIKAFANERRKSNQQEARA